MTTCALCGVAIPTNDNGEFIMPEPRPTCDHPYILFGRA